MTRTIFEGDMKSSYNNISVIRKEFLKNSKL